MKKKFQVNPVSRFLIRLAVYIGALGLALSGALWVLVHPSEPLLIGYLVGIFFLLGLANVLARHFRGISVTPPTATTSQHEARNVTPGLQNVEPLPESPDYPFSRDMVRAKVVQHWPQVKPEEVMSILDQYGVESYEMECARVQLGILKLSEGQRERLPELVKSAKIDYRDLLAYAEYPEEMMLGGVKQRALSPEELRAIRQRDRNQYLQWLKGL